MTDAGRIIPRQQVPELKLPTLDHGTWQLHAQNPQHFTLIFFYRGYHCPQCRLQLRDADRHVDKFIELGVQPIAISADSGDLARKTKDEWKLEKLPIAYDLPLATAQGEWGLFISNAIKPTEPEQFSEPGIFVVRPDGTLYASVLQTMPFARPDTKTVLASLETVIEKDYPARGEA